MQSRSAGRRSWRWRALRWGAAVLLLLAVGAAALVLPRWGALQLLLDLHGSDAIEPRARILFAAPAAPQTPNSPDWQPGGWLAVLPDEQVEPGSRAGMLMFHGITQDGLADERLQRAVQAFARREFVVVAPEIAALVRPDRHTADIEWAVAELERFERDSLRPAAMERGRYGAMGASIGGALLLRAIAVHRSRGGVGPAAVLLVGVPFDLERLVARWVAPAGPDATARERADLAFARGAMERAAVPGLLGDESSEDRDALAHWLARGEERPDARAMFHSPAVLAFALEAAAGDAASEAHRTRVAEAAWQRVQSLSLAGRTDELALLADLPIWLVHGASDRLIPPDHAEAIARSLPGTRLLLSSWVGHAEMGEPPWLESWEHVVWLDGFLDALAR